MLLNKFVFVSTFCQITVCSLLMAGCTQNQTKDVAAGQNLAPISGNQPALSAEASYRLGAKQLDLWRNSAINLDRHGFEQGLRDALDAKASNGELSGADWQTLVLLSQDALKAANLNAGKQFLENNKGQPDVVTLASGVQYKILKTGKSTQKPGLADKIGIVYKITSVDGQVKVDNLSGESKKLYEIQTEKVFSKGWREALLLMPKGSTWRIFIPAELAFGEKGYSNKNILPNETLIIDTYLDSIDPPAN